MRVTGDFFRGHDPRWSWSPLSGEGASSVGGRFNEIGIPALYLANSIQGVIGELSRGFKNRMAPITIVTYLVDCDDILDLTEIKTREDWGISLDQMSCPWRSFLADGKQPPSWKLAKRLRDKKVAGILTPSFANKAEPDQVNLVLWDWDEARPHQVLVHDPDHRLPKDQSSWKA